MSKMAKKNVFSAFRAEKDLKKRGKSVQDTISSALYPTKSGTKPKPKPKKSK
jgi:hypothetical protein